jgi:hypothetical protein
MREWLLSGEDNSRPYSNTNEDKQKDEDEDEEDKDDQVRNLLY